MSIWQVPELPPGKSEQGSNTEQSTDDELTDGLFCDWSDDEDSSSEETGNHLLCLDSAEIWREDARISRLRNKRRLVKNMTRIFMHVAGNDLMSRELETDIGALFYALARSSVSTAQGEVTLTDELRRGRSGGGRLIFPGQSPELFQEYLKQQEPRSMDMMQAFQLSGVSDMSARVEAMLQEWVPPREYADDSESKPEAGTEAATAWQLVLNRGSSDVSSAHFGELIARVLSDPEYFDVLLQESEGLADTMHYSQVCEDRRKFLQAFYSMDVFLVGAERIYVIDYTVSGESMQILLNAAKLRAERVAKGACRSSMQKIPFPINQRGRFSLNGKEQLYGSKNNILLNAIERKKDPEVGQVVKRIRFYTQAEGDVEAKERPGAQKMGCALVRRIIEREFSEDVTYDHVPTFHFLRGVGGTWVPWRQSIGATVGDNSQAPAFGRQQASTTAGQPRGVIEACPRLWVLQVLEAKEEIQALGGLQVIQTLELLEANGVLQAQGVLQAIQTLEVLEPKDMLESKRAHQPQGPQQ